MASAALYLWTTTNPLLAATGLILSPKKESTRKGGVGRPLASLDNCVDVDWPQHMLLNRVPTIITLGPVN